MPDVHALPASAGASAERDPAAPSASGIDALGQLRSATQDIHRRLDRGLPLARPDATLDDYLAHLGILAAWLRALAPAWDLPGADAAWTARNARRLGLIGDDLRDGGRTLPPPAAAPDFAAPPDPAEAAAFAWGLAYVVEGSQLGGRMLHRSLAPRLAPHPLRYLRGSGDAADWHGFTKGLRAAVSTPAQARTAADGARTGFEDLVRRFEAAGELR
jgi:heme oxygenase